MNKKTISITLAASAVAIIGMSGYYYTQGKEADLLAQMRDADRSCLDWYTRDRDLGGRDPFTVDSWEKDGSIVVEMGFDRKGSSYSTRLCVFDPQTRRMSAPNNFTRARWEK